MFSMRIVNTEWSMETPVAGLDNIYSDFRKSNVFKNPVITVFGSTLEGQKCCLCLHGIYPYIFIKADESKMTEDFYLSQLASNIDRAVNSSFGKPLSNQQHIFKISLVTGLPLYGFHMKEEIFLKIFIYNPALTRKIAGLLLSGCIMGRVLQPHESHIPYTLQAMIDFKLFGMSYIKLSKILFKLPLPTSTRKKWNVSSVDKSLVHEEPRLSNCELEADAVAADILNPHLANASSQEMRNKSANPGLLAVWEDEKMRRRRKKMNDRVTPPSSPERKLKVTAKEQRDMEEFKRVLRSLTSRNSSQSTHDASLNSTLSQKRLASGEDSLVSLLEDLSSQKKLSQKWRNSCNVGCDAGDDDPNDTVVFAAENSSDDTFDKNNDADKNDATNRYNSSSITINDYNNDIEENRLDDFLHQIEECDSVLSQVPSDPRDLISNAIMLSQASNISRSVCHGDDDRGLEKESDGENGVSGSGSDGVKSVGVEGCGEDGVDGCDVFGDDLLSLEMSMCFDPDEESLKAYCVSDTCGSHTGIRENHKRPVVEEIDANNKKIKKSEIIDVNVKNFEKHEKTYSQSSGENTGSRKSESISTSSPEFSSSGEKIINDFIDLTAIAEDDENESFHASLADSLVCNYESSLDATLTADHRMDEPFSNKKNDKGGENGNDSDFNVFSQIPQTKNTPLGINKLSDKFKKRRKAEKGQNTVLNNEDEEDETLKEYFSSSSSSSSDLDVLEKIAFFSSPEEEGVDKIASAASIIGSSPSSTTPTSTTPTSTTPSLLNTQSKPPTTSQKKQQIIQNERGSIERSDLNTESIPPDSAVVSECGVGATNSENVICLKPFHPPPSYHHVMSQVNQQRCERVRTGHGRHIVHDTLLSNNKEKFEFVPKKVSDLDEFKGVGVAQPISGNYFPQLQHEYHNADNDGLHIQLHPIKPPPSFSQVEKQLRIEKISKNNAINTDKPSEISLEKSYVENSNLSDNKTMSSIRNSCKNTGESPRSISKTIEKHPAEMSIVISPGTPQDNHQTPEDLCGKIITSTPFSSYKDFNPKHEALKNETVETDEKQTKDLNASKSIKNKFKKSKCRKNIFKPTLKVKGADESRETILGGVSNSDLTNISETNKTCAEVASPVSKFNISIIKKHESSLKSQIDRVTPNNKFNFKVDSQCAEDAKENIEKENLNIISIELHIHTRNDLQPDPEYDAVKAICYCMRNERTNRDDCCSHSTPSYFTPDAGSDRENACSCNGGGLYRELGVLVVVDPFDTIPKNLPYLLARPSLKISWYHSEPDLIRGICDFIQKNDSDILLGYEIENSSWGFLIARASYLNLKLSSALSPLIEHKEKKQQKMPDDAQVGDQGPRKDFEEDMWEPLSHVKVPGRILINLWRVLRYEVSLNNYTFENTAYHILHRRFPHFSHQYLTNNFHSSLSLHGWKTLDHYLHRCEGNMSMMEKLDLIGQTSEMCRIYGIEFFDVLNRGSQYRVESMILRIAKPQNLIAVSPSALQRAQMDEPQCIPLNLEPVAGLYSDPVVVLDFQSLYPSVMIAHNYCFSTCLGRISLFESLRDGPIRFGCTNLYYNPELLKILKDDINVCSNGVAFVKENIKKGVISQMVEEILKTRIMVKNSMKLHKNDKSLEKVLHSRQLSLKLIANVTFGYTAARFSGRMACVEVGDSIVRKARDIVEEAISLVERNRKWCAQVLYGDTDSLFVLLKGRSKSEAFVIGQEIEEAVTKANPKPIKLKLEKVLMPCMLTSKKRYAGLMYETAEQQEAQMLAKGIETIRRDNCPVVSKMLEKVLKILFNTFDMQLVKSYVQKQCLKVLGEKLSIMDYTFGKEYRGMRYYKPGSCIPALEITRKNLAKDRRSEPLRGQRVPYVVVYGMPGVPLIRLVRSPSDLVADPTLRINTVYYILKQILPPINRFTSIIGVDAFQWYHDLPKIFGRNYFNHKTRMAQQNEFDDDFYGACPAPRLANQITLTTFFTSSHCPICDSLVLQGVCDECQGDSQRKLLLVAMKLKKIEGRKNVINKICSLCMGWSEATHPCESYDCSVFFKATEIKQQTPLLERLYNEIDF